MTRDEAMSPGGMVHCRELHRGEREILCLLQTYAECPCSKESSNLSEREREREREMINSNL